MFRNPATQSFKSLLKVYSLIHNGYPRIIVIFFSLILLIDVFILNGCAVISRPVPLKSLSLHEVTEIISSMKDQEYKVSSFYTVGSVAIKGWIWESDAEILIAGTRNPLKMKIEITVKRNSNFSL